MSMIMIIMMIMLANYGKTKKFSKINSITPSIFSGKNYNLLMFAIPGNYNIESSFILFAFLLFSSIFISFIYCYIRFYSHYLDWFDKNIYDISGFNQIEFTILVTSTIATPLITIYILPGCKGLISEYFLILFLFWFLFLWSFTSIINFVNLKGFIISERNILAFLELAQKNLQEQQQQLNWAKTTRKGYIFEFKNKGYTNWKRIENVCEILKSTLHILEIRFKLIFSHCLENKKYLKNI